MVEPWLHWTGQTCHICLWHNSFVPGSSCLARVLHSLADGQADRLKKGTPVFLSGRLRSASWRDDDENPHYLVEIQARNLQILHRTDLGANGAIDTDDTA